MKYTCEIRIDRPRAQIVTLYSDHANLGQWYPGFVSFEPLVKNYGVVGSTANLFCQYHGKVNKMLATIERIDLPEKMTMRFECDDVWHRNESQFFDCGDHTIWQLSVVFGFKGLMRWTAKQHLPYFKNSTIEKMEKFKAYALEKISPDQKPAIKSVKGFSVL